MYRKYQNLTTSDAFTRCYQDMGTQQCAHALSIQIMQAEETEKGKCHWPAVKQSHDSKIEFLLPHCVLWYHKCGCTTKRPNSSSRPREPLNKMPKNQKRGRVTNAIMLTIISSKVNALPELYIHGVIQLGLEIQQEISKHWDPKCAPPLLLLWFKHEMSPICL